MSYFKNQVRKNQLNDIENSTSWNLLEVHDPR